MVPDSIPSNLKFSETAALAGVSLASAVELALALQHDRNTLLEALRARDAAVSLVVNACRVVGEKVTIINVLEAINTDLETRLGVASLHSLSLSPTTSAYDTHGLAFPRISDAVDAHPVQSSSLRCMRMTRCSSVKERQSNKRQSLLVLSRSRQLSMETVCSDQPSVISSSSLSLQSGDASFSTLFDSDAMDMSAPLTQTIRSASMQARLDALSSLPLPSEAPVDALCPFILPQNAIFAQFIGTLSEDIHSSLGQYVVFEEETTVWCSDREEHGCLFLPSFECSTNPRMVSAHNWVKVDVLGALVNTTHCFYHKNEKFYYAGTYLGIRLDDLDADEWAGLPHETTRALLKKTLAGRANVSPANNYEVAQLYDAGALTIACIGLQCVGFDQRISAAVLNRANDLAKANHHPLVIQERASLFTTKPIARQQSLCNSRMEQGKVDNTRKHSF